MLTVTIKAGKNGWLNQKKLRNALFDVFSSSWIGEEVHVVVPTEERPNSKQKIDIAFELRGRKIAVEYDGNIHYINTKKCLRDIVKDQELRRLGFDVVRFPYYLELDDLTFFHFFKVDVHVENVHPQPISHGFNETEWLPIDFCPLGIRRFKDEFLTFPLSIQSDIIRTLAIQSERYGLDNVVPFELQTYMDLV